MASQGMHVEFSVRLDAAAIAKLNYCQADALMRGLALILTNGKIAEVAADETTPAEMKAATPEQPPPAPANEDDDFDDEKPATDPIGKRVTDPNELVDRRCERIMLVLNQLGPLYVYDLVEHCKSTACRIRYALGRTGIVVVGNKYAASRVSALWGDEDEAMFGPPKVSTDGKAYGNEALRESRRKEAADAAEQSDDEPDADVIHNEPPPVVQKTETWMRSDEHPEHKACQLCDSEFRSELICVATDYHGTSVMCQPCARRAGFSAPPATIRMRRATA